MTKSKKKSAGKTEAATPEPAGGKHASHIPPQIAPYNWKPGQSGNPLGRPKGSRNKLAEDFIKDLHEAWQTKGKETIEKVISERPHEFLKVVAGLLPKEIKIKDELSEFSDEQLAALNALAVALIGDAEGDFSADQAGAGAKALN